MKKVLFKGCATAIVTPFTEDSIDFESLAKLLEFQISQGADAIVVCGTTGESSTMTVEEKLATIEFTIQYVNKRVPVIAGTGGNCTNSCITLSKQAEELGADGLLLVTPYYNKTTQEGLVMHYRAIASSTTLPIILYNVPSRTGLNLLPQTCLTLAEIPNIVAIKEASGNLSQVAEIASLCQDNLTIYSGNDDQILPILSLGGQGVISVLANIMPNTVHNMVHHFLNGNFSSALSMQLETLPLIQALFCEVNPIPVKAALSMLGYSGCKLRLPLVEMSSSGKERLQLEMKKLGLI